MEKSKASKLAIRWYKNRLPSWDTAVDFVEWLYKKGFTIETRFQGKDLKEQEELFK